MAPLVSGNLVAALLESLFYGLYFVLFTTTLYLFRRRHGLPPRNTPATWVLIGLSVQFFAVTAHWITTMYRTMYALGYMAGGTRASLFYANLGHPTFVFNVATMVLSHTLTDSFVLHRLYVVFLHERNVMIFPSLCLVVQTVSAVGLVVISGSSKPGENYLTLSNGWLTCKLITSIVISLYSSGMISWRIIRVGRALTGKVSQQVHSNLKLTSLIAIFVESAALQTAMTILMLISFARTWSAGEYITTGTAGTVFAITTVLIHARIGLGWTQDSRSSVAPSSSNANSRITSGSTAAPVPVLFHSNSNYDEERELEKGGSI